MVDQERKATNRYHKKLHTESIMVCIVSSLELEVHEVHRKEGRPNEEAFHDGVVWRDEGGNQIQIACEKNQSKQDLCLARNTCKHKISDNIGGLLRTNKKVPITV